MNKIFEAIFGALMFAFAGVGLALLCLVVFFSEPTGTYHTEALTTGFTSNVYQDVRFGKDKLIYTGPTGKAFEVFIFMNEREKLSKPEPAVDPGKTALQLL